MAKWAETADFRELNTGWVPMLVEAFDDRAEIVYTTGEIARTLVAIRDRYRVRIGDAPEPPPPPPPPKERKVKTLYVDAPCKVCAARNAIPQAEPATDLESVIKSHVLKVLKSNNGHMSRTAKALGIGDRTLQLHLQRWGVKRGLTWVQPIT